MQNVAVQYDAVGCGDEGRGMGGLPGRVYDRMHAWGREHTHAPRQGGATNAAYSRRRMPSRRHIQVVEPGARMLQYQRVVCKPRHNRLYHRKRSQRPCGRDGSYHFRVIFPREQAALSSDPRNEHRCRRARDHHGAAPAARVRFTVTARSWGSLDL